MSLKSRLPSLHTLLVYRRVRIMASQAGKIAETNDRAGNDRAGNDRAGKLCTREALQAASIKTSGKIAGSRRGPRSCATCVRPEASQAYVRIRPRSGRRLPPVCARRRRAHGRCRLCSQSRRWPGGDLCDRQRCTIARAARWSCDAGPGTPSSRKLGKPTPK